MAYSHGGVKSMEIDVNRTSLSNHLPGKAKGKLAVHKLDARKRKKRRWLLLRSRDALIDIEDDEVKVNPFLQQEPRTEEHDVPFFHITGLFDITPRLKVDLVDWHNSNTVTVVIGSSLISQFASFLSVGSFVRIEGSSIKTKNKADGGTSPFSLYVDATSIVTCIGSFPIHLSFYPETKIRFFLDEATSVGLGGAKSYLGTLAFVVIKSENFEIYTNSTRGELLVANGSTSKDQATVSFVNDRKEEYNSIKRDGDNGEVKTFVARNVGAFLGRENTLSVLDLTILVHVHSKHLQYDLLQTYKTQVESLGYGKQLFDVLRFSNINGVLLETLCAICKSNKVHKTT
ncbi:hypothetical protein GOP47_0028469 [Adiantum capillus-veneris]|nr:hypothetical protein GOP47_0028469 [Adiantum capillus-veneris]